MLNKFLNTRELNLEEMPDKRKDFLDYAGLILDDWSLHEKELNKIGCNIDYPYKLKKIDACYYLLQHLLDFLQEKHNSLVPKQIKHRLQLIYPKQFIYSKHLKSEYTNNNIYINNSVYLISHNLASCLKHGYIINKQEKKNMSKKFFYVVIFNKVWNSRDNRYTLVYNYMKYNKKFILLYYLYASIEQSYVSINKQNNIGAGYFFILDKNLDSFSDNEVIIKYKSYFMDKNINNIKFTPDFINICKSMISKLLISLTFEDISFIIANLANSSPNNIEPRKEIAYKLRLAALDNCLLHPSDIDHKLEDMKVSNDKEKKELYNDISRFLFIVSDVRGLVNCIKKSSIYTDTNPGPTKNIGGHSMIGNILYDFDKNFRHSMYNHHILHKTFDDDEKILDLDFDNFSYKNIHCNLGYSKW